MTSPTFGLYSVDICYGNMGYEEFNGGTKNQRGFVPNIAIFREKIHILKNG